MNGAAGKPIKWDEERALAALRERVSPGLALSYAAMAESDSCLGEADAPAARRKKKDKRLKMFALEEAEEDGWGGKSVPKVGGTVWDRVGRA